MKDLNEYSSTLAGITAHAIDSWLFYKSYKPRDSEDALFRAGQMKAFSRIILLATGRRIGTELNLVQAIAKQL